MQRLPDFRLPDLKLPSVRVPSLRVPKVRLPRLRGGDFRLQGLRLPRLDVDEPGRLSGHLQFFFYLLMFVALLAIFAGSTGTAVVMLIAGAALHVLRSSLEEVAAQRQARRERAERKKPVRLRSHRAAQRARAEEEIRVTAAPAAKAPPRVASAPRPAAAARATATPRLSTRRRPAVAQPGPSPARKQRVI
jgi:hypothetical protein